MIKRFNVSGPCRPQKHYMLPAAERLPTAPGFVEQEAYFVVHAPRQTGKTTTIRALAQDLTTSGRYVALAFSGEDASAPGDDYERTEGLVLQAIRFYADALLPEELRPPQWPAAEPGAALKVGLGAWARACPLPVVLFYDEIDSLQGASLIHVLKQLRSGYSLRPENFPSSVILCGLKDVRDYKRGRK